MTSPSRWRISLAGPGDAAELAAVYDSDDGFGGDIAVKFTRHPDPLTSLLAEGDQVVMPVVHDNANGRMVGFGACVIRQAHVNGVVSQVGYLTGMKALPEYRGGLRMIPAVYAFLRDHCPGVDLFYTTILTDNTLAQRMLERPRASMPEYRFVGDYVVHCYRTARRPMGRQRLTGGSLTELRTLARSAFGGAPDNLQPINPPPGLGDDDVRLLRDPDGRPIAGCLVWDQRASKRYIVSRYGGRYRHLARLPLHWFGFPRLPRPGVPARHASLGFMAAPTPAVLAELVLAVGHSDRDYDFLMVGCMETHPWAPALGAIRAIRYRSRLYTVHWRHGSPGLDGRPITLDVGLL